METIKNGVKWLGAYINGVKIKGLTKNGVIFYKTNSEAPTTLTLTNKVFNADFSDGTNGFSNYVNSTIQSITEDGYLAWIKRQVSSGTFIKIKVNDGVISGRKYYYRASFKKTDMTIAFNSTLRVESPRLINTTEDSNNEDTNSFIFDATTQTTFLMVINSGDEDLTNLYMMKEPMFIDVTDLYGLVGTTDEEIKNYMDNLQFFSGELNINV